MLYLSRKRFKREMENITYWDREYVLNKFSSKKKPFISRTKRAIKEVVEVKSTPKHEEDGKRSGSEGGLITEV